MSWLISVGGKTGGFMPAPSAVCAKRWRKTQSLFRP